MSRPVMAEGVHQVGISILKFANLPVDVTGLLISSGRNSTASIVISMSTCNVTHPISQARQISLRNLNQFSFLLFAFSYYGKCIVLSIFYVTLAELTRNELKG